MCVREREKWGEGERLIDRETERDREGERANVEHIVFKAHGLLYHSTLGSRGMKKKRNT